MAFAYNITVEQGATYILNSRWNSPSSAPVDLTAFTASMDVRDGDANLIVHLTTGTGPTNLAAALAAGGFLTAGQTYFYKISSVNAAGLESAASLEVSATPASTNLSIALTWTAVGGSAGYNVYRGTSAGGESLLVASITNGAANGWTDQGASPVAADPPSSSAAALAPPVLSAPSLAAGGALVLGTPLFYTLTALTAAGETVVSNEVTDTPASTNLSVVHTWTAVTGADGYNLYRGTAAGGEDVLVATIHDGTAAAFTDDGATATAQAPPSGNTAAIAPPVQTSPALAASGSLTANTTYYYVITSTTAAGESTASHEKYLATDSGSNLKIVLNWQAVAGATGYQIYRSLVSGEYGTPCFLANIASGATVTYTDDGLTALSAGAPPGNLAVVRAPVQANTSLTAGGSLTGGTYYWVVTALTDLGETVVSNEKSATTSGGNLTANAHWAAVPGATGYNLYRTTVSGTYGATSFLVNIPSGATVTYADTGAVALSAGTPPLGNTAALPPPVQTAPALTFGGLLTPGQPLFYVVTAISNTSGETTASNEETATPVAGSTSVALAWDAVDGAAGYQIYRSTESGVYGTPALLFAIPSGSTLSYIDDGTIALGAGAPPGNTAVLPAPTQSNTSTATTGGALAANTYFYEVTGLTLAGETVASNEKSQVVTGNKSKVVVSWSALTGANGYSIYRGTGSGLENVLIGTVGAVTSFVDFGANPTSATPPDANTATIPAPVQTATSTSATGGALAPGSYYYVVTALVGSGESLPSNEESQVTTGGASANTISWGAVTGATGFNIYRGTVAGGENTLIGTTGAAASSFVDYGELATVLVPPVTIDLCGKAGTVSLTISAAGTASMPPGNYNYDLFLASPTGVVTRLLVGTFVVIARITLVP